MDGSIARPRPLLALTIRLLSILTLATMAMLLKLAGERGAHLLEMIFWRQALTVVLIAGFLAAMGRLASVKTTRFKAHAMRAITGITGMVFVYGAIILLPLAEATVVSFTTPFFAVLISVILFGDRVGLYRGSAVALGFAGILIIVSGGDFSGGLTIDPWGLAVGLVAAILVPLISFQIQDLNKTESPWTIVFWFTALTAPLAALSLPFVASSHDPATWALIGAMALCGAIAQLLLTASLRFGSAAVIMIMDYTSLIWATLYGWYVFGALPSPTLWIGAPLIIGAGLLIAYRERILARAKTSSSSKA
ncbi:MAG: DMT family transporter [Erythrobacter sp.]